MQIITLQCTFKRSQHFMKIGLKVEVEGDLYPIFFNAAQPQPFDRFHEKYVKKVYVGT